MIRAHLAVCALICAGAVPALAASPEAASRPGAYCPLPKAGEKPECLSPAQAEYGAFFSALERGEVDTADESRLVSDLRSSEPSYLALSSLVYGYYRLAQDAAEDPTAHPGFVARLELWNELLASAYADADAEAPFRSALREAAVDLHETAPAVELACDEGTSRESCSATFQLVNAMQAADATAGIQSPLSTLLGRMLGLQD